MTINFESKIETTTTTMYSFESRFILPNNVDQYDVEQELSLIIEDAWSVGLEFNYPALYSKYYHIKVYSECKPSLMDALYNISVYFKSVGVEFNDDTKRIKE